MTKKIIDNVRDTQINTITTLLKEDRNIKKLRKLSLAGLARLVYELTDGADVSGSIIIEIYDLTQGRLL